MKKKLTLNLFLVLFLFLSSCAASMSPLKLNSTLPTLTTSKFMSQTEAEEAIKESKGKYLVKGRKYVAPIGLTAKDDLTNGAKGIDEWVKLDGGNAYLLVSYNWITIDAMGTSQLHIVFDTLLYQ